MNDKISQLLQNAFENYDFGEGVTVEGTEGWTDDGSNDYIRVVYVIFDEQAADSYKVSFHCVLNEQQNAVIECYALLVENGDLVGHC